MSTYYRKLWETTFGEIPKDDNGRTFEIHHIDGNRENNSIENLMCVSIQEHYDIHFRQGDWGACQSIAIRMDSDPNLISELARLECLKKVELGQHPWLKQNRNGRIGNEFDSFTSKLTQEKRVIEKTHNWLSENGGSEKMKKRNKEKVENGTHNLLGSNVNKKRIENKTHNFLKENGNGERMSDLNRQLANRKIVFELRELKQKYNLKLGSGWTRKSTEVLEKLFNEIKEKHNEQFD